MKYLGSPLLFIMSLVIFIYLLIRYRNYLLRNKFTYRYLLLFLRYSSIIFLLYLTINPWFSWDNRKYVKSQIAVIFDISKSMYTHLLNYEIKYPDLVEIINLWSDASNIDIDYFGLGEKIKLIDDINKYNVESSYDLVTNFSNMENFIDFHKYNNILLISDGVATEGLELNQVTYNEFPPIYSIGVGPTKLNEDLEILDIIITNNMISSDSLEIIIKIKSELETKIQTSIIITNLKGIRIYDKLISFNEGNHLKELILKYPKDSLLGFHNVEILPVNDEMLIENNKLSFNIDSQNILENIILITGSLSSNSTIIRKNLNKIKGARLKNYFRYNVKDWNKDPMTISYKDARLIVLDDFPNNGFDKYLFDHIISVSKEFNKQVVYIQGPALNLDGAELIHENFLEIKPLIDGSNLLIDLDHQSLWNRNIGFEIASIPPQKRNIKWINERSSLMHYLDKSLLLANLENFYIISLPNLAESYYKTGYNNQDVIDGLLDKVFINAYYGEERILLLTVDGKSFNLGENVNLTLDSHEGIKLKDFNFNAVIDKDTIRLDCDEYITNKNLQCNTSFVLPGEYIVFSTAELVGNKRIYSNMEKIFINIIENEMNELIQNKNALIKISYDTGGVYSTLDSLDVLFKQIDISQVQLVKKHKLSALSTHNYWWILLVILSIEWFFRKKDGLL